MPSRKTSRRELTASKFLALSDAEKERIYRGIDRKTPEELVAHSKPLTPAQRRRWNSLRKKLAGRPRLGANGTRIVSVTVERGLLKRADALAKAKGLNRSQLFSEGIRLAMREHEA